MSYFVLDIVSYCCSASVTSVGMCLLSFTCNYVVSVRRGFPLPLGALDGLRYLIVALPEPYI